MSDDSAVAIVGLSGRYPGAGSLEEFWANLRDGVCSITDLTERELLDAGVTPEELRHPDYVRAKGILRDADRFEADLFGFTRAEAAAMDPQHRLLLETAWAALEDAGVNPRSAPPRTGVYVGGGLSEHMVAAHADPRLAAELGAWQVRTLTDKDYLATWISYRLGLDGPSMTVQTACSTSLTAVHLASQALLAGECDTALAGGVCVDSVRPKGYMYYAGGISSPDGRCRPFDERAAGTLAGNGVGLAVLRRLGDALADGDPIRAVIRGTAVTNDGNAKVGFTAPGVARQTAAIVEAWAAAGLDPASAQYVEMHGTATALGDRIEVEATAAALREATPGRCGIGSVKSNIGHLDAAAGIAGLTKLVLMLQNRTLAPTVNVSRPHPELKLETTPFHLVDRTAEWEAPAGGPRLAGLSSLGIGGTNVHAVLEEAPRRVAAEPGRPMVTLLPVSARSAEQVAAGARRLAGALRDGDHDLRDAAHTLRVARAALPARGYVLAGETGEAVDGLDTCTALDPGTGGPPVLLFPGQGAEYPDLGAGLYEQFPVFRRELDACAEFLLDRHGLDPRPWRVPGAGGTRYWQPALVAVGYSLARLWQSCGVAPGAMVGHSIGEYAAAGVAGVLTVTDALHLAAVRGDLMERTEPGRMLAVALPEDAAADLLGPDVDLAAVNGPRACVLSGTGAALDALTARLDRDRVAHRYLGVDRAFHSRLMEPVLAEYADHVARIAWHAPELPYVSTLTGTWVTAEEVRDPAYWVSQIRRPVRFADAVATAGTRSGGPLLELGPGNMLTGQARRVLAGRPGFPTLGAGPGPAEPGVTWRALGEVWARGYDVDWPQVSGARRVHLPTYPFAGPSHGALSLAGGYRQRSVPVATPVEEAGTATAEPAPATGDVVDLLSTTLGLSGPDDLDLTYFAAGGDSLTAVHIVGRLRDEFGIEIPVVLLLEPITLRELAERIERARDEPGDDLLESLLGELEAEGGTTA